MTKSAFSTSLRYILIEVFLDILYFPVWWYTKGLSRIVSYCIENLVKHERRLALRIWLQHLFKPMYGDYTKEGRIISFMMRVVVLLAKLVLIVFWVIYTGAVFILWLVIPLILIYYLLFQLFNAPFFDRLL